MRPEIWDKAIDISIKQRVVLLLYDHLKKTDSNIPLVLLNKMHKMYRENAIRSAKFERSLADLDKIFTENGIQLLVLKGITLSYLLYNDPNLRPCADLDILVKNEKMHRAKECLVQAGYSFTEKKQTLQSSSYNQISHHWRFYNKQRGIHLELHNKLAPLNRSIRIPMEGIWQRAQSIILEGHNYYLVMDPVDLVLYMSVHNAMDKWESLLHINDFAAIFIRYPDLDWLNVLQLAKEYHCYRRFLANCYLTKILYGFDLPSMIHNELNRLNLPSAFINASLARCIGDVNNHSMVYSTNYWYDTYLADSWQDRCYINSYKVYNQLGKAIYSLIGH